MTISLSFSFAFVLSVNALAVDIVHVVPWYSHNETLPFEQRLAMHGLRQSIWRAKTRRIGVKLIAAVFPEDADLIPLEYDICRLSRSTSDQFPDTYSAKKLPFIEDIFRCGIAAAPAEKTLVVLTNADIVVAEHFHTFAFTRCAAEKHCAFTANRRVLQDTPLIAASDMNVAHSYIHLRAHPWKMHTGTDCFVMTKNVAECINVDGLVAGYPPWGSTVRKQMSQLTAQFEQLHSRFGLTYHIGAEGIWLAEGKESGLRAWNEKTAAKILINGVKNDCSIETD